jgi:hypothetical protein
LDYSRTWRQYNIFLNFPNIRTENETGTFWNGAEIMAAKNTAKFIINDSLEIIVYNKWLHIFYFSCLKLRIVSLFSILKLLSWKFFFCCCARFGYIYYIIITFKMSLQTSVPWHPVWHKFTFSWWLFLFYFLFCFFFLYLSSCFQRSFIAIYFAGFFLWFMAKTEKN